MNHLAMKQLSFDYSDLFNPEYSNEIVFNIEINNTYSKSLINKDNLTDYDIYIDSDLNAELMIYNNEDYVTYYIESNHALPFSEYWSLIEKLKDQIIVLWGV